MGRRATRLSISSPTTPIKYCVCVHMRTWCIVCVPAIIFTNRTKYVVVPILGDELSHSKTEEKVGKQLSKIFLCFQGTFLKGICQALR